MATTLREYAPGVDDSVELVAHIGDAQVGPGAVPADEQPVCADPHQPAPTSRRSNPRVPALAACWIVVTALAFSPAAARAQVVAGCGGEPTIANVWSDREGGQRVYLEDYVHIGVCGLDSLLATARRAGVPLTLFVNGIDAVLAPVKIDRDSAVLTFTLDRTDANREIWKPLLYDPLEMRYDTLHLSTGLRGGVPALVAPDADNTLELDKIWIDASTILWTLGFMVLFIAALYLGSRTDLLREGPARGGRRQAFSLGRVQMAWWFVLTVGAFLLIWVLTGDRDTIPTSILTLLGISAATALAAQQVTPGVVGRAAALQAKADAEAEALAKALDTITQRLAALGPVPAAESGETAPPPDPIRERLVAAQARLTAERQEALLKITEVDLSMPTRGFWRDIVSNELGVIALDRLQIVVWTLVLGGVFIHSVRFYLTIPEFNSTLLLLQGISSGTYVGFKFPTARST